MSEFAEAPATSWLTHLGDIRWVRGHISTFFIGAVLLVCLNLLLGSDEMWSLTAVGIWIMLLVVHIVIVLIARLSQELLSEDDDEEVVLLPIKEAVIIEPNSPVPPSWTIAPPASAEPDPVEKSTSEEKDNVSWSVATDMAQAKRAQNKDKPE